MNETLAWIGAIGGFIGAIAGIGSAIFAWMEWRKVNRKIAMVGDMSRAGEILPTWYTERMMGDYWTFGLWTVGGQVIVIKRITGVSDDGEWMDVELATADEGVMIDQEKFETIFAVAADRTSASIKVANVVSAMELVTS
ncbi:hypothetical protein [Erythrobacter sp. YT30]|uniref:hypothetical protein n=1 Tax=Erythrobacter sp. YT30 TaxID=1735012 RepID=UPI00076C0E81|nr:hypothetical protein [Erythrobacter sp. YT30]KWV91746.1 hypothetical protein AUC45_11110 [Erythrobacter sp. YT30]